MTGRGSRSATVARFVRDSASPSVTLTSNIYHEKYQSRLDQFGMPEFNLCMRAVLVLVYCLMVQAAFLVPSVALSVTKIPYSGLLSITQASRHGSFHARITKDMLRLDVSLLKFRVLCAH